MHVCIWCFFLKYAIYNTIGKILNKLVSLDNAELKQFLFRLDLLEKPQLLSKTEECYIEQSTVVHLKMSIILQF